MSAGAATAHASFAERCGADVAARRDALAPIVAALESGAIERLRLAWFDLHGLARAKTLYGAAARRALDGGIGMVSTLLLKDASDRTAYPVFEPGGLDALPGFGQANNVVMLPDPASWRTLPWSPTTGWLRCDPWFDGAPPRPVAVDPRGVLRRSLARLAAVGYALRCGLEVEFHVYRRLDGRRSGAVTGAGTEPDPGAGCSDPWLDPSAAPWPPLAPAVALAHPGWQLLGEAHAEMAREPLAIVERTALGLGLPLASLEVELGPSQFEAVFDPRDALAAADDLMLFRSAVRVALARAGWHATFMCRPPFDAVMSSGWHLHQSLVDVRDGRSAMGRDAPAPGSLPSDASHWLSDAGEHHLAGLLAHADGMLALCVPTVNGHARFRPNALAPDAVCWGRDNRGALLRVLGGAPHERDAARIENRIAEPAANPYLALAAQAEAALDGLRRGLRAPPATQSPYGGAAPRLAVGLGAALDALERDVALADGLGRDVVGWFARIKRGELARHAAADDPREFERREYFGRI